MAKVGGFAALVLFPVLSVAQPVTRMISDSNPNNVPNAIYNSTSSTTTPYPNNRHNLLAFQIGSVIYSTGANNALLDANSVSYQPTSFQGFNVTSISGNTSGSSLFLSVGKAVDGDVSQALFNHPAIADLRVADVLNDGLRGLDIGTGITNLPAGTTITFAVGCVNPAAIGDAVPDILVSQIADPSGTATGTYRFLNASMQVVGTAVSPNFAAGTVNAVGRTVNDFFTLPAATPFDTADVNGSGNNPTGYRDIRLRGLTLGNFGIDASNVGNIAYFQFVGDGNADIGFVAYNNNSLTTVTNQSTWAGTTSTDWNTASNWFCGAVPTSSKDVVIPVVTSAQYPEIANANGFARNVTIASGSSLTVSGGGNLSIAGAVTNSGTFTAANGGLTFNGSAAQTLDATSLAGAALRNLTISNNAGVTLNNTLYLSGIFRPQAGAFNTNNSLYLTSGPATTAMVDQVTGSVVGSVTVERFIPARRAFRFLTSSVNAGTIRTNWQENGAEVSGYGTDITGTSPITNGFDPTNSNNASMFNYDNLNTGTSSSWNAVTNTNNTNLVAGHPYRIMVRGDRTVDLSDNEATPSDTRIRTVGNLVTGSVVVNNLNPVDGKASFVGNPYQAPVNMQTVLAGANRINPNFYTVWDPTVNTRGAFVIVDVVNNSNNFGGSSADRYLQPGQAFFVTTVAGVNDPSLTFAETSKYVSTATTPIWRAQEDLTSRIRMTLFEAGALAESRPAADGFVIEFSDEFSNDMDLRDARKSTNQDENAGMVLGNTIVGFQSRQLPVASDVIELSHTQYRFSEYVYRADVSNMSGPSAYLHDKFNGSFTLLESDAVTDVAFTVDASNPESVAANRFEIVFQSEMSVEDNHNAGFAVYPNPVVGQRFFVNVPQTADYKVVLTNMLGQQVGTNVKAQGNQLEVSAQTTLAAGIYTVTISDGATTATQKIIVN